MSFSIRFATAADMTAVHQLITELAIFEKEPDAVTISVEDLQRDGFTPPAKFQVVVAETNDGIVGMALFYERYSTWKGKAIHLEDLIVTQSMRNKGVGKALYTAVMEYAYEHGAKRVAWEVLDWNTNAIAFYESTGAEVLKDWGVVHMNYDKLVSFLDTK